MFTIKTYNCNNEYIHINFEYHCLYILENGEYAYIGESNNPTRRLKEHQNNSETNRNKKYKFERLHVITGDIFEETPAKHYENLLIKLMKIDNKFIIINRNDGQRQHYSRKNIFELQFDKLWLLLEEKNLINTKSFTLIINSNIYKYSPYTILTKNQYNTLTSIIHTLDSGEVKPHAAGFKTRPVLINGDAGSGKTVIATSLFYYLKNNPRYKNKKIALIYANPSTRREIQDVFKSIKGLSIKDVISPSQIARQHYDIIICDEAQRLRQCKNLGMYSQNFKKCNSYLNFDNNHDELDWILNNSDYQILFYDKKQSTSPSDIIDSHFKERLYEKKRGIRPIELQEQMRIMAGHKYVPYIYDLLYKKVKCPITFKNYDLKLFNSFSNMISLLKEKENEVGLCRLCSSYAWEWVGKEDRTIADIIIEGVKIRWNSQTAGWISNPATKNEMGSIYTLAGIDLNYAGVVLGPDISYDIQEKSIKINKNHFFDNKVKKGVTDEELKIYILNTYAVLLTRGIRGTYIYVCDKNLREYLQNYIQQEIKN